MPKGIPLIVAAGGNDSVKRKPAILRQTVQDLFDALKERDSLCRRSQNMEIRVEEKLTSIYATS